MAYTDNGPRAGRNRGRNRNTLVNNASKLTPGLTSGLPAISPASAAAYGAQSANLTMTLGQRLAALRQQKGIIRSDFLEAKADARANAISGMASTVNAALERGVVGSSFDLEARAGVEAQRAKEVSAAIRERMLGKLGLAQERTSAFNEYYGGLYEIQAAKAAEQATMANQAFLQDAVMRMGDEQSRLAQSILDAISSKRGPDARPASPGPTTPLTPEQQKAMMVAGNVNNLNGTVGPGTTGVERAIGAGLGAFNFLPDNVKRVVRQLIAAGILPKGVLGR